MEFTDEQKGLLRCPSGRCTANLLETGVDLVDTDGDRKHRQRRQ
jgi:hypothetical protein